MKRIFLSTVVIMLILGCSAALAQSIGSAEKENRTAEEKECYRLIEVPDSELSLDEQILKCKIGYMVTEGIYVEKGEFKTKLREEDFLAIGAKPFLYKLHLKHMAETNQFLKSNNIGEEEVKKNFDEAWESWHKKGKNETKQKIDELVQKKQKIDELSQKKIQ